MTKHLRTMAAPYGITFADFTNISNSRNALLAAEFARAAGGFEKLHVALFTAYFSEGLDIGDIDVLGQIAGDAGLDQAELTKALRQDLYADRLATAQERARSLGVSGVPAFIIGEKERIVGAQPIEVFRTVLKRAQRSAGA